MIFFNMNICRNNTPDIRQLTEYAHDHHIATDYHINETPMLEQDEHFKHLTDNPTYIRPEDWPEIDLLVDWLIQKNKAGYQMVNSVQRLQEIKAFIRMASGADLKRLGRNGDGSGGNGNIASGWWKLPESSKMQTASCTSPSGTVKSVRTTPSSEPMGPSLPVFQCTRPPTIGEVYR